MVRCCVWFFKTLMEEVLFDIFSNQRITYDVSENSWEGLCLETLALI